MRTALIIVDVQNDFCEGGTLAVSGGAQAATDISEYLDDHHGDYAAVAATQDWHIEPGDHFSENPDFRTSWPVHCVAETKGAEIHKNLDTDYVQTFFRKGAYDHGYSGFEALAAPDVDVPMGEDEDLMDEDRVSLDDWLRDQDIEAVDVVGIAFDHCVRATAKDAVDAGYETRVLVPLTAAVNPDGSQDVLEELEDHGVNVVEEF